MTDSREEDPSGNQITAGRTQTYIYNNLNQLSQQSDDYGTPGTSNAATADDEKLNPIDYTNTGLLAGRTLSKSDGAGGWTPEQVLTDTYFKNGLLKQTTTTDGAPTPTTLATHTLSYITGGGVYMNGNRVSDVFQLHGPVAGASCYATTCTATWTYDARDRLVQAVNGTGLTTDYGLDVYGNVTQENHNGTVYRIANYTGNQLTSDRSGGTDQTYLYDAYGNLDCVMAASYTGSTCPIGGSTLELKDNIYDGKNRLIGTRSYYGGNPTDSSDYTLDALDRTVSETEYHQTPPTGQPGTQRTDFTYIGLSPTVSQEQLYDLTGPSPTRRESKAYAYDGLGERMTIADTATSTTRYSYIYDPKGSVELLVDQNRVAKASYGYDAYGNPNASLTAQASGFKPETNFYRYDARRFDSGSNTIDYGARRYSPGTGRFIQLDSYFGALDDLGLANDPLSGNRYALEAANPINFVDVDGHFNEHDGGGGRTPPSDDHCKVDDTCKTSPGQPGANASHGHRPIQRFRQFLPCQSIREDKSIRPSYCPRPLTKAVIDALRNDADTKDLVANLPGGGLVIALSSSGGGSKVRNTIAKWFGLGSGAGAATASKLAKLGKLSKRSKDVAAEEGSAAVRTVTALTREEDEALNAVMRNPNSLEHIFGQGGKHNLAQLTQDLGGERAVVREAILRVSNEPEGAFKASRQIGPYQVTITGRVMNGVLRISNIWVPK